MVKVYSKTDSKDQVRNYFKNLSGRKHFVYGGICNIFKTGKISKKWLKQRFFLINTKQDLNNKI